MKSLRSFAKFVLGVCITIQGIVLADEPFVPDADEVILETLPRDLLSSRDALASLRKQMQADPDDIHVASRVASSYLRMGSQNGDPRFFGYAQAALADWWETSDVPSSVLRVRAKLQEKDHNYRAAIVDLELLLQKDARDVQAWIELSNIHRVLGEYEKAQQVGDQLAAFAGPVPIVICEAPLLAATGRVEQAYAMLERIPPATMEQLPSVVGWRLASLAEYALQLGKVELAESHFETGLAKRPSNLHLIRGYGDLLIDTQRYQEALDVLRPHLGDNGVLLRAALAAERAAKVSLAQKYCQQLENRFAEIRLRGSKPHGRFESRFALQLQRRPLHALELAEANWRNQKEFRDSYNLLAAALAADLPAAAAPVLEFLRHHNVVDQRLAVLIDQLEAKP